MVNTMAEDKESMAYDHLNKGVECERAGDWMGAIARYRQVVEFEPDHRGIRYFGHNNQAYALIQLGRFAEAEMHCEAAIAVDGDRHNAHKNLGLARQGLGRYAEAAHCFVRAARIAPADIRSWKHLRVLLKKHPSILDEAPDIRQAVEELGEAMGVGIDHSLH